MHSPLVRFHVLTIFPGMFESPLSQGIVGRARQRSLVEVALHDIRDHATDRHRSVDDYPFGGGPGMVMTPGPLFDAVEAVKLSASLDDEVPAILLSPQGRRLDQSVAEELSRLPACCCSAGGTKGSTSGSGCIWRPTRSASATMFSAGASWRPWSSSTR